MLFEAGEARLVRERDVWWVVATWSRLQTVIGELHHEEATDSLLKTIFNERRVATHIPVHKVHVI